MTRNKVSLILVIIGILLFFESAGVIYFANKYQLIYNQTQVFNKQMEDCKSEYEKSIQQIQKDSRAVSRDYEAVKQDRNNLLVQVKNLLADKSRVKELEDSVNQSSQYVEVLKKEKLEIQSSNVSMQEELKKLDMEHDTLLKERNDFKAAYDKAKKDDTVKKMGVQIEELKKENIKMRTSLKAREKNIDILKSEKGKLEALSDSLKKQTTEVKKNLGTAARKNDALEGELKRIPHKFSEIARQNKVLIKETAEMHYNLGVFYTKNKKYERAIAEFEKVLDINPNDASAHFNLGYIYAEYMVNREKAIEHFRHFLRLAKGEDNDVDWVRKYLLTWETYEGKSTMK
jgi:chromosome segregation ATPase